MNPENHYTERLSLTKGQLQQVKKQIFRISMLRLTLFIAGTWGLLRLPYPEGWSLHPVRLSSSEESRNNYQESFYRQRMAGNTGTYHTRRAASPFW